MLAADATEIQVGCIDASFPAPSSLESPALLISGGAAFPGVPALARPALGLLVALLVGLGALAQTRRHRRR